MKQLFTSLIAIITLFSCTGKTHLSELTFEEDRKMDCLYAYRNGEVYSGSAWSSDEKSFVVNISNGVVRSLTFYHANGNVAVSSDAASGPTYYDEDGNVISKREMQNKYPELVRQMLAITREMPGL